MIYVLFVYVILFSFLIYSWYGLRKRKLYAVTKLIVSAVFLSLAFVGIVKNAEYLPFIVLIPAFFLCFVGDVFLGFAKDAKPGRLFMCGIAAFWLAHVFFSLALLRFIPLHWPDIFIPLFSLLICFLLTTNQNMQTGTLRSVVLLYSLFVSLFFARACSLVLYSSLSMRFSTFNMLFLLGSALFFLSDFIILFLYFYRKRWPPTKFFNLLCYYSGMILLALAMWK